MAGMPHITWRNCLCRTLFLMMFTPVLASADDDYDHPCPVCTQWDASARDCIPMTTPPYTIPSDTCSRTIRGVPYVCPIQDPANPLGGRGGYILPPLPLVLPNNLFVTNRCYNGKMRYRIEGRFTWDFDIYVVNKFRMTTGLCYPGYDIGDFHPREPAFVEKTKQHELTHCDTIVTVINQANDKVQQAGWFSSYGTASSKKQQIINETATEWTTARTRVLNDQDVAGQPKTIIEGDCYEERQIGTW